MNQSDRLHDLLSDQALIRGDAIRLASGRTSTVYFNVKRPMFDPEALALIAEAIWQRLIRYSVKPPELIGGMAMGAVPIVAAVCARSWPERPLPGFFVRKEVKEHGTESRIDGQFRPGSEAVLLEDVTTTGGSTLTAARAVREAGGLVSRVITIIDREEGATSAMAAEGLALEALYRRSEFDLPSD